MYQGLQIVTPSSVTVTGGGASATINAGGSVTFSSCTGLSLNNVFSSTYDNYLILYDGADSGAVNVTGRLRNSGVDDSSSNYTYQQLFADGTSVSGSRTSATSAINVVFLGGARPNGNELHLYGPYLAQPTAGRLINVSSAWSGGAGPVIVDYAWTHALSVIYDGISFLGTTSASGRVSVYGKKK